MDRARVLTKHHEHEAHLPLWPQHPQPAPQLNKRMLSVVFFPQQVFKQVLLLYLKLQFAVW